MRTISNRRWWGWAGTAILAGALTVPLRAQDPDDQKRGVARVSVVQRDVSVQRGDSGDWVAATVNAPLVTRDRLATGNNSRAEVQFDGASLLRIGGTAEVSITQLEYNRIQVAVAHGTVTFRVLRASNADLEVDTPSISVRPSKLGSYRIAVTDSGETEVTARSGEVEVFSPTGSQWVRSGQTLMARGAASDPEFQMVRAAPGDEWDRWNDSRDQMLTRSASTQYVGPGVYGAEDLDPYGNWVDVPGYGNVWQPVVAEGWAPYRQGRWVWEDWYGWTWVSYEPWGWAPYHYGRWFYQPAYGWCWYPGAIGVRHYWSPALVAFFGFGGGVGVSFGIGNVGWVPLAPYEVFRPWWGRGYYGGATYINRSVTITNVNVTNIYRNSRIVNGVTAVSGTDFRSGRFNSFVRVSGEDLRAAGEVRGPMPIAPDRTHLQFADRQTAFVPRSTGNTRFFTREQPNPVARVPFAQQQRALESGARAATPSAIPPSAREPALAARGWNRFGAPSAVSRSEAPPAARDGFRSQPYGGNTGNNTPPPVRNEFQNRPTFSRGGDSQPARPEYQSPPPTGGGSRFGQPGRTESPRMSAPVVRDRPSGGGGFSAPPRGETRAPSGGGGNSRGNSGNGNRGGGRTR